jgi:hypothetical protein
MPHRTAPNSGRGLAVGSRGHTTAPGLSGVVLLRPPETDAIAPVQGPGCFQQRGTVRLAVAHGRRVPASGQTGGTKSDDVSLRIRRGADASISVVDISDLNNPEEVALIPTSQDTRPGEGMQVLHIETAEVTGDVLVVNEESWGKNFKAGFSLWDVMRPASSTGPRDERPISKGQ